jgi:hypothetical protein
MGNGVGGDGVWVWGGDRWGGVRKSTHLMLRHFTHSATLLQCLCLSLLCCFCLHPTCFCCACCSGPDLVKACQVLVVLLASLHEPCPRKSCPGPLPCLKEYLCRGGGEREILNALFCCLMLCSATCMRCTRASGRDWAPDSFVGCAAPALFLSPRVSGSNVPHLQQPIQWSKVLTKSFRKGCGCPSAGRS